MSASVFLRISFYIRARLFTTARLKILHKYILVIQSVQ